MLRTVRAFTWMRWRVARNTFRSQKRDTLEQLSRVLATLAPFFLVLMLVPTVLVLSVGAWILGSQMGKAGSVLIHSSWPYLMIRAGLAIGTIVVLIAPMVRSSRGTGSETTRLLLLPIRRPLLHLSEVIGALSDPWLGVLVPPLLVFPIGLAMGGELFGGALALLGSVLFVSIVMLAVSLASFAIALVFRKRRRAEWFTIVLITGLSMSGFAFGLWGNHWGDDLVERKREARRAEIERAAEKEPGRVPSEHFDSAIPAATRVMPSESYMRLVKAGVDGEGAQIALELLLLGSWTAVLYAGSRWSYSRLLETPETGGGSSGKGAGEIKLRRVPGTNPVVSSVAMATMRLALRTVRGKTGVYLNCVVVGFMYFLLARGKTTFDLPDGLSLGMGIGILGGFFTLLSLQPILINIFAIDGSGLTLQALSPVPTRDLLLGKFIGGGLLALISTVLCFAAGIALDPSGSPLLWLAAAFLTASLFPVFAPIGMLLSLIFPKVADLSRMGKDGNPQPIAAFISTFTVPLLMVPPGLLTAGTLLVARSIPLTLAAAVLWFCISAGLGALTLRSLVGFYDRRRENLLLVAAGR